jgi:tRNA (guanosine-2'-O-)-methyltransferase
MPADADREMHDLLKTASAQRARPFEVEGVRLAPERITELLRPHMTAARFARIDEVVRGRTYALATVVEGLVNTGNVSAVMRSAEALGSQRFHIVEGENDRYKHSQRTSQGAEKWLDVWRWPAPAACAARLRDHDYRVVAACPSEDAVPIGEIDFSRRTALVVGNEAKGISEAMRAEADRCCVIPTPGFTESFNVSVAAAVALYHARQDRLRRQGEHADLSESEQAALRARFCMRSVGRADEILRRAVR